MFKFNKGDILFCTEVGKLTCIQVVNVDEKERQVEIKVLDPRAEDYLHIRYCSFYSMNMFYKQLPFNKIWNDLNA